MAFSDALMAKEPKIPAAKLVESIKEASQRAGAAPLNSRPAPPDSVLAGTRLDPARQHLLRQLPNTVRRVSGLDRVRQML
jgi:hypothetical protein